MSEAMMWLLARGVWETLAMTFVSATGFVIGLPVGVRSMSPPFSGVSRTVRCIACSPRWSTSSAPSRRSCCCGFLVYRVIVGTSIGLQAAIVPLTVGAAPFISRMVENALLEIPTGLIEASRAMGATQCNVCKVLLPEAMPGLVNAATITLITLVGYSAMGGAVGAGGLGQIGYQYGYIGYNATVMNTVLVLLVELWFI
ncbi:methionine ABC transporter permease MetI [Escherichia coli]